MPKPVTAPTAATTGNAETMAPVAATDWRTAKALPATTLPIPAWATAAALP
jgi:hypothetical protein